MLKKAFSQNERQQDVLAATEEENYNSTSSRLTGLQQREPVKRAAAVPWEILFFKTKADLSTHYGPPLHRVVKKCHPHIQPILLGCLNKLQK